MADRTQEYRWYLLGCERLGQTPLPEEDFLRRWQEFEDHAEKLKEAEAEQTLASLPPEERAAMQRRIQTDPFVKAVLVGQAEAGALR